MERRKPAGAEPLSLRGGPSFRGSGLVDVTYWEPLHTGMYDVGTRGPHRHDYHQLMWTRSGVAVHDVDGRILRAVPGSLLLIRRGQVHDFLEAFSVSVTSLKFDDDLVDTQVASLVPAFTDPTVITVPKGQIPYIESLCDLLYQTAASARTAAQPSSRRASAVHRSLLHALMLLVQEWHDAPDHSLRRSAASARNGNVAQRFGELLELHFAHHHEVSFYADKLALTPDSLRRILRDLTGSSTKDLILDRVMAEAARLLRTTDVTIAEVSRAVGFDDALYFSRAFKRVHGVAPTVVRRDPGAVTQEPCL